MPARQPRIVVRLQADRTCHLSREPRFSLVVFLTLHDSDTAITLLKDGHGLSTESGPMQSVSILECLEIPDSDRSVQVLGDWPQQQQQPQPRPRNETRASDVHDTDSARRRCRRALLTLHPHRTEYVTFTTAIDPRDSEWSLNPAALRPGRDYTVRFDASARVTHWAGDQSREEVLEFAATHHGSLPPPSLLTAISWDATNTVSFSTRASAPQPPRISVSLAAPTTLSRSNHPPFTFSLTFTSHAPKPITVLAERDRVKLSDSDIEILDAVTQQRVAPDLIDDGNIDGPWRRDDFLRLDPEVPCVERRVLDPTRRYSGLEELRVGSVYVLRVLKGRWDWWSEESVDEVMRHAGLRGDGSLGAVLPIDLVCGEEVRFEVVE